MVGIQRKNCNSWLGFRKGTVSTTQSEAISGKIVYCRANWVEKELRRSGTRVDAEWKMNADGFRSLFCNTDMSGDWVEKCKIWVEREWGNAKKRVENEWSTIILGVIGGEPPNKMRERCLTARMRILQNTRYYIEKFYKRIHHYKIQVKWGLKNGAIGKCNYWKWNHLCPWKEWIILSGVGVAIGVKGGYESF